MLFLSIGYNYRISEIISRIEDQDFQMQILKLTGINNSKYRPTLCSREDAISIMKVTGRIPKSNEEEYVRVSGIEEFERLFFK